MVSIELDKKEVLKVLSLNPLRSGLGFNPEDEITNVEFFSLNPLRSGLGFNEEKMKKKNYGAKVSIPSDRVLVSI